MPVPAPAALDLFSDVDAASRARTFTQDVLAAWRLLAELCDLGVLAVSELVANSLQYGTPHECVPATHRPSPGPGRHLVPGERTIGNLAAANLDQLAAAAKRSLRKTQYRPLLIDGCLIGTGLTLTS